jgi:uncharacterized delta-60 repeat protein
MKTRTVFILLFILFARINSIPKLIPGTIDRSFGGNGTGFRLLSLGASSNAQAVALDSRERIVCAGIAGIVITVARFTSKGLVDLSFGGNGTGFRFFTSVGGNNVARGLALDSQERIICAGRGSNDFIVIRFTQDGLLDLTFGGNGTGFRLLNLGGMDLAQSMVLDSQERIVCAGQGGLGNDMAVARFTPDGLVDLSFGGNGTGFRLLNLGGVDRAQSMALDSQERIVCAGFGGSGNDLALARFTQDGLLDLTFGGNGTGFNLIDLGGDDRIEAIALDSQERIVCAGRGGAGGDMAVARFTPDGLIDLSFGGNGTGFRLLDLGGSDDRAEAMSLDTQGRIVCAGQGGGDNIAAARFTQDGLLDPTFGGNGTGFRLFDLGGGNDRARAMILDDQERIVGAGQGGINADLSVVRIFGEILSNYAISLREKYK